MTEVKLPDFDDLMKLTEEITKVSLEKSKLSTEIELGEAVVVKEMTINEIYFVKGKPPSMDYIKKTFMFTGFDNLLLPKREQLAELSAKLKALELKFDVYKTMIDVWRTSSANARRST